MGGEDPTLTFRAAAERYVAVIDGAGSPGSGRLLAELADALPALYAAAVRLPAAGPLSDDPADDRRLTSDQWKTVFDRIQTSLDVDDHYRLVLPLGDGGEMAGSLADDLADIYGDVKEGLELLAAGEPEDEVASLWRDSFWSHWGEHAANALRVIHAHLAEEDGPA